MTGGGQTSACVQVPLPVMHAAGEDAVLIDFAGLGQVGAKMRAAALNSPVADLCVLCLVGLLRIPVLDVLDAIDREAFEERRQELVELTASSDRELHREEDRVRPIDLMVADVRGDEVG